MQQSAVDYIKWHSEEEDEMRRKSRVNPLRAKKAVLAKLTRVESVGEKESEDSLLLF